MKEANNFVEVRCITRNMVINSKCKLRQSFKISKSISTNDLRYQSWQYPTYHTSYIGNMGDIVQIIQYISYRVPQNLIRCLKDI